MSSSHEERAGGYLALGLAGAQESKKKKSLQQHCNLEAVMAVGLLHRLPQPM